MEEKKYECDILRLPSMDSTYTRILKAKLNKH